MRRSQTVRHNSRPSIAIASDELGALREGNETNEDILRRQLLEKDRECDRLQTQLQTLQSQLKQRVSVEAAHQLEKDAKEREVILQGTLRENERFMTEIDRGKAREKMLERELVRLLGDNWQTTLEVENPPQISSPAIPTIRPTSTSAMTTPLLSSDRTDTSSLTDQKALADHVQAMRLLVLGMQHKLENREKKLFDEMEKATQEAHRYDEYVAAYSKDF